MPATLLAGAVLISFLIAPGKTLAVVCVLAVAILWFKGQARTRYSNSALRAENVWHEAGHNVIAKNRGAGGVESRVTPEGRGWTALNGPWNPIDDAVVTAAGSEAANAFYHGHDAGVSSGDLGVLRDICNRRRMREQGFTVARARELARADVLANRAAIKRVRDQLDERGKA